MNQSPVNEAIPLHLKSKWFSLVARLQGMACMQRGHAIITIKVLVNNEGLPVIWSEPKLTKLEPLSSTQDWIDLVSSL